MAGGAYTETNLSVTCSQPRAGLLTVGHSTGRRHTDGRWDRSADEARTPEATVLQLVPHFTSQELLLLLHCGIDGGGDVGA